MNMETNFVRLVKKYGTTTGRNRRCGWFDTKMVHDACKLNGVDEVIITKIDVLDSFDIIPVFNTVLNNVPSTYKGWNCETLPDWNSDKWFKLYDHYYWELNLL
jgi:adenylosuccinate synthase